MRDRKRSSQLWCLAPHAASVAFFVAAFVWMLIVGTNRSQPDLNLAIVGYVALPVALVTTIAWCFTAFRQGVRRIWPWLLGHLGGLALALALAAVWLGAHLV